MINSKPTKRKILFVSPVGEFYGGGERSGFEFCKFLEKQNFQVITAVPRSSKVYVRELKKSNMDYRLLECDDFENQIIGRGHPSFSKAVSQLVEVIKKDEIALVITNLYAQSGPIAAVLAGVPNISMDRGQAYEDDYFADFMTQFSDAVIVNSMGLADIYKQKYDIDTPVAYSYTARPLVGLDETIKPRRLVCVSRVSPEKNLLEVLKAAKILKAKNIFDGDILMIGPVPGETEKRYKKQLEAYAKENNLISHIHWLGDQKNPWKLVGQNDIYLNTSDKESIGRSSIEAIKLGVPAILADIPGHKDIFEKIGAVKYRMGDSVDLAEKITQMIQNYPESKRFAETSRQKAEDIISKENCYKNVLPLINSIGDKTRITSTDIFAYITGLIYEQHGAIIQNQHNYEHEIALRDRQLAEFLGIKRSARLLLGNIKRKIKRSLR